eukprot:scaffold72403_cov111-Phaeocystis_antarctica.AAC.4
MLFCCSSSPKRSSVCVKLDTRTHRSVVLLLHLEQQLQQRGHLTRELRAQLDGTAAAVARRRGQHAECAESNTVQRVVGDELRVRAQLAQRGESLEGGGAATIGLGDCLGERGAL